MDSVTICNMALMAAGIPPITSFEETNDNAKLCKSFYPVLRDRVLRDHSWSFATSYLALQQMAEKSPDPEYPFVAALPGDLIRVIATLGDIPFRRIGNKLLVKELPATCLVIRKVEDPNLFDPAFIEALQNLLSAEFVLSASRDIQQAQYFRQEYERKLAIARSIDSQENSAAYKFRNNPGSFIASRFGYVPLHRSGKVNFVKGNAGMQVK
jgi:hypothetical protein